MAAYTVLANRYRPRAFDDVVGQADIARVLQSAIARGRAGHAYLLSGPRGVGKTSMARILAKAFNCLENDVGEPCGACRVCRGIDEAGDGLDVVEIDGASHNKVENVRELIENLRFRPVEARYRIYIVDEVHMLSTAAFNALLKTLEEPPEHAKFILATTEPLKVPETIRSRCQMFDFRRLRATEISDRLATICAAEGIEVPEGLTQRIARHAMGGLRDALSLLDQLITYGDGKPSLDDFERLTGRLAPETMHRIVCAALDGDGAAIHAAGADALQRGARPTDLVGQLTEVLEGLLVMAAGGQPADRSDDEIAALSELAANVDVDRVLAMLDVLVETSRRLKERHDGRLVVEMALLTLSRIAHLQSVADLLAGMPAESPASPPSAPGPRARATSRAPSRATPRATPSPGSAPRPAVPTGTAAEATAAEATAAEATAAEATAAEATAAEATAAEATAAEATAAEATADARPAEEAPPASFRERFLAGIVSRALTLELTRYRDIRLEGEQLVLVPPAEGASVLFDPEGADVAVQLVDAGRQAAGREVTLRVDRPQAQAATEASASAASSAPRRSGGRSAKAPTRPRKTGPTDPVKKKIQELWPDAENID